MKSKLKGWLLIAGMLALVLVSGVSLAQVPANEHSLRIITNDQSISPDTILADGQFVYGPNVGDFQMAEFLDKINSPLALYATILEDKARYYSLNPRVLLTVLEIRSKAVTEKQESVDLDNVVGYTEVTSFNEQVELLAKELTENFYDRLYGTLGTGEDGEQELILRSGDTKTIPNSTNAGTYTLLVTLAALSMPSEWTALRSQVHSDGFVQTYRRLFPDSNPLDNSNQIIPNSPPPSDLFKLPFEAGNTWYFSSGPHPAFGPEFCNTDVWSGVDFAPGVSDCIALDRWITAPAAGTVSSIACGGCQVYIDHTEGWGTRFYHVANPIVSAGQSVSQDQRIGNPSSKPTCGGSCGGCSGGADGTHGHHDLVYNGAFVAIEATAFEGWVVHGTACYQGYLNKNGNIIWSGNLVTSEPPTPTPTPTPSDTTPPTTSASFSGTSGNNGWYRSNVQVTLTANEPVNWIKYRINGGSWTTYSSPFSISDERSNTLEYYAQDTSGNTESTKSATVKIDKSAPTSSCPVSPASSNGWYNTPPTITCSGSDGVSGLESIQYNDNGAGWQSYGGSFTVLGEGEHTVTYYAQDQAGNSQAQQSLEVNVDESAPSVASFTINNDAPTSHNRTVLLASSASDAISGVAQMCASYNQIAWECRAYEESTPFALPLIDLHEVNVYFYVTDAASNESAVVSDTIALDFYPPMPHSGSFRICQDVLNAAGESGLASSSFVLTSALGEAVVSEETATSNSFRSLAGFLSSLEGCLPIERTVFGYRLLQSVMASGGNLRSSNSYKVGDTLGEPVASHTFTMQSSSFQVQSGFWANVPFATTSTAMSLQTGWNHISLPLEPAPLYTAESLCDEIASQGGSVTEIDRWHNAGWDGHVCGVEFNDFDLVLGESYFIKADGASSWTMEGIEVREALSLTLQIGWNSISIPHTDAYTAESLCHDFIAQGVSIVEIDRWHTGGWSGHVCGLPFNDFNIEPGTGYFVKSDSAGTVTPSELPSSLQLPEAEEALQAPLLPSEMPTGKALPVRDLRLSNLTDTSVTLSWMTDKATTGYVSFGADKLEQVAVDSRGAASSSTTHVVVLDNLNPETTYHFEIISGGQVAETGSLTTAPSLATVPKSDTIYGQVKKADGTTPAAGALLYLTLTDADGAGSAGEAGLLSAIVDDEGYWHANLGNARLADGSNPFTYSASDDYVHLSVQYGTGSPITENRDVADLHPAAPLILEQTDSWLLYLPLIRDKD